MIDTSRMIDGGVVIDLFRFFVCPGGFVRNLPSVLRRGRLVFGLQVQERRKKKLLC
jgi:hypothetical protein